MGRVTVRRRVLRVRDGATSHAPDALAAEEPMEIRVNGRPVAVTMRTPGNDFDLAVGFLVSEGVVRSGEDVRAVRYCAGATADGSNTYNVIDVALAPGVPEPETSLERNFYTTSSCGLCGKASLDAVRTSSAWSVAEDASRVTPALITSLPDRLREARTKTAHARFSVHPASVEVRRRMLLIAPAVRGEAGDKDVGARRDHAARPLRGTSMRLCQTELAPR